jgi:hypothetical protein
MGTLIEFLVVVVLVALPVLLRQFYRKRLLEYLRQQRPDSYQRLSQTEEVDYETKRVLWGTKGWSYYLESWVDDDDPRIKGLKRKILWCGKTIKFSILLLIGVGALSFLLSLLIPLLMMLV